MYQFIIVFNVFPQIKSLCSQLHCTLEQAFWTHRYLWYTFTCASLTLKWDGKLATSIGFWTLLRRHISLNEAERLYFIEELTRKCQTYRWSFIGFLAASLLNFVELAKIRSLGVSIGFDSMVLKAKRLWTSTTRFGLPLVLHACCTLLQIKRCNIKTKLTILQRVLQYLFEQTRRREKRVPRFLSLTSLLYLSWEGITKDKKTATFSHVPNLFAQYCDSNTVLFKKWS